MAVITPIETARFHLQQRRGGKTALQWHLLKAAAQANGGPVVCVQCQRPHDGPPPLGRCTCGGYLFGVRASGQLPLEMARAATVLDFHGGES